ncbi:MAG TPA: hypothetical protein PLZ57_11155 [Pseudobdellovibrionaceae bacterium]|nr:hypothetical protein [Pseudobdellovibrionaceae bacterium]
MNAMNTMSAMNNMSTLRRFEAGLRDRVTLFFLRRVARTARGQAHLLQHLANAESEGEIPLFDAVAEYMERVWQDEGRAKLARIHREDETRHVAMLEGEIARLLVNPQEAQLPESMSFVPLLGERLAPIRKARIDSDQDVAEFYSALLAIEVRTAHNLNLFAQAFRENGNETGARILKSIADDEVRHQGYCRSILGRCEISARELELVLRKWSRIEAWAFARLNAMDLQFTTERGILLLPRFWIRVAMLAAQSEVKRADRLMESVEAQRLSAMRASTDAIATRA